jgi:DNA polymerase-3 subunit gamma/tau
MRISSPTASASAKPVFSPFQADRNRKNEPALNITQPVAPPKASYETIADAVAAVSVIEEEPVTEITPVEVAADLLGLSAVPVPAFEPEATPAPAAVQPPAGTPSAEAFQRAATEALMSAKSQGSAADALADAAWTVEAGEIRVQTELSKTMLPMVVNPEADKIVRAAIRAAGAGPLKLVLLPGAANANAAKKPRPARTGSAQAKAMEHPVVQQAQRLFNAEIRNVIDLRDND